MGEKLIRVAGNFRLIMLSKFQRFIPQFQSHEVVAEQGIAIRQGLGGMKIIFHVVCLNFFRGIQSQRGIKTRHYLK